MASLVCVSTPNARTREYGVRDDADGRELSTGRVLTLLSLAEVDTAGAQLADDFTRTVAACPCEGVYMEWAPVSPDTYTAPFRMVLVDEPLPWSAANDEAFRDHVRRDQPTHEAVSCFFPALSRRTMLVVPRVLGAVSRDADLQCYAHLAAFMRGATPAQTREHWAAVADGAADVLTKALPALHYRPEPLRVWVSTSGRVVPWLHTRVSLEPSYYHHAPYANQ